MEALLLSLVGGPDGLVTAAEASVTVVLLVLLVANVLLGVAGARAQRVASGMVPAIGVSLAAFGVVVAVRLFQ